MIARRRHMPLRSCVICGNKTDKRELMRIVAPPEGGVAMDPIGKMNGRGAYVCGDGGCVQTGLKRGRLEYALRRKLTDADWTTILASVETISVQRRLR